MTKIVLDRALKNSDAVNDFIAEQLMGYSMKLLMQVDMAVEEICSAYDKENESISISCDVDKDSNILKLVIEDSGVPHNPLMEETADKELGIILTQKLMDSVEYENSDGINRITMQKKI